MHYLLGFVFLYAATTAGGQTFRCSDVGGRAAKDAVKGVFPLGFDDEFSGAYFLALAGIEPSKLTFTKQGRWLLADLSHHRRLTPFFGNGAIVFVFAPGKHQPRFVGILSGPLGSPMVHTQVGTDSTIDLPPQAAAYFETRGWPTFASVDGSALVVDAYQGKQKHGYFFRGEDVYAPARKIEGAQYAKALLQEAKKVVEKKDPKRILVLGTGIGADAIALARMAPNAHIVATDVDKKSIAYAQLNARFHGVEDRIEFGVSDLFENVEGVFDLILFAAPRPVCENFFALTVTPAEAKRLAAEIADLRKPTCLDHGAELLARTLLHASAHMHKKTRFLLVSDVAMYKLLPTSLRSEALREPALWSEAEPANGRFTVFEIRRVH